MRAEVKVDTEKAQIDPNISENVKENGDSLQEIAKVYEGNEETEKVGGQNENKNGENGNGEISLPQCDENIKEIVKGESSSSSSSPSSDGKSEEHAFSIKQENEFHPGLNGNEKKALMDLRSKLEEAILKNKLFKKNSNTEEDGGPVQNKGKAKMDEEEEENESISKEGTKSEMNKDITLWGVPLLPSKGDEKTDILLIKFLRAREFDVKDAFLMLKNTLEWRKDNNIDSIMEENFGNDYNYLSYMTGLGRKGHIVCYNIYGMFANDEFYNKTFGTEASRDRFLRWRLQLMEKQIQKLDFGPDGISSLIQVNDLKNTPGPSRRDLRNATKRAVEILQDNYPEFVAMNIFINVPFWYYAFSALLSPFLTTRTKSKFVYSRPSRVTDTLLKYITTEEIPANYGGLQRKNDPDFSTHDVTSEIIVKASGIGTIEIPVSEVGSTLIWDLVIVGWDVNYKEEFVPNDESSYTLIVKKERNISWQDESIRNTFKNNEPGKVVITIENGIFKKKRVFYRYKTKNPSSSA